ncbi:MAG: thermonuclease family protein, partial [Planctomycetia bacterium]
DTPETVKKNHPVEPWGPEATAFTRERITNAGYEVRLEFDRERKDHYGRFLAYVWIGDEMLNEELLRAGLGKFLPQFPYSASKKRLFLKAEQEAQDAQCGIWSN